MSPKEHPYRPEIDGLRMIAVVAVVLYHFGMPGLSGGFAGVDVFFVISGYLIGGILWRETRATGRISLARFYIRRVKRLAPAFFAMTLAASVIAWLVLLPFEFREYGKSLIAATVYLSNVLFFRGAGYFDTAAETKVLLHTWSLSVEEQFYIFLPLALLLLARWPRVFVGTLWLCFAVSLVASVWFTPSHQTATFYLFPFRAWELLAGVLLAIWSYGRAPFRAGAWISWLGLGLVIASLIFIDAARGFPGWQVIFPVLGTMLLLLNGQARNMVNGVLSMRGPVFFGKISYSLYLCDISPEHTQPYSGGNARIYSALQDHVGEVDILPQSWGAAEPVRRAIYALPEGVNLRLRWRLHLLLSQIISRSVTQALAAKKYDVVFGAYSFQSMARLKTPYPMLKAFTADASFTVYKQSEIGARFGSSWLSRRLLDPLTFRAERAIYQNLDLALWPSDWLKREADTLYDLSESQSVVVPWGANIDTPKAEATPLALSKDAQVNLLVVGRDWFAKGGPVAFETMNILSEAGVDARLTVVGTQPPDVHINPYVKVHRALNKAVPRERALFEAAFRNAHFLVQPSFESWGFAFCEAAAYSLPSLCLSVGGVPVQDGITGHDLPQGSSAIEFAEIIQGYLKNPVSYAALRLSSRAEFEASLNWDAWGRRVHDLLEERLASGMLSDMSSRT